MDKIAKELEALGWTCIVKVKGGHRGGFIQIWAKGLYEIEFSEDNEEIIFCICTELSWQDGTEWFHGDSLVEITPWFSDQFLAPKSRNASVWVGGNSWALDKFLQEGHKEIKIKSYLAFISAKPHFEWFWQRVYDWKEQLGW